VLVAPAVDHPSRSRLDRLTHEYELKDELDTAWAARPLALMHDAASLAAMGQQNSAIDQFARADAVSEEGVRSMLASFEFLRSYLGRAVAELMEVAPPDHAVRDLWLKYFPPI